MQDLYHKKQSEVLHAKERKTTDHTKLFPGGRGRHLTCSQFVSTLEDTVVAQAEKKIELEEKKETRKIRKKEQEEIEREWMQIKDDHEREVATWKAVCDQLTEEGVPKRQQPKRPIRQLKPKLPKQLFELEQEVSNGEDVDSDASSHEQ